MPTPSGPFSLLPVIQATVADNPRIPDAEGLAEQILEDLPDNFDISGDIEPEHLVELTDPEKHTRQKFRTVTESLFLVAPES